MQFFTLVIGIFLIVFSSPASAQVKFPCMMKVKSDRVYVRAGQNVNFETIAVANKGDTLAAIAGSYGWIKVKAPAATKAYVKGDHVTLLAPELGEVRAEKLNVRSAANTNATIIGQVTRGTRLSIAGKEGDWLLIKPVDQVYGWVKQDLVEPLKGVAVPARMYPEPVALVTPPPVVPPPDWLKFVKKLDNGDLRLEGVLKKSAEGEFRIVRGNVVVGTVSGPESLLGEFADTQVEVVGKPAAGWEQAPAAPVVKLLKIKRIL